MRRIVASILAAVFSFALLAPALSGDTDAALPSCCRRSGKHHCSLATPDPNSSVTGNRVRQHSRECKVSFGIQAATDVVAVETEARKVYTGTVEISVYSFCDCYHGYR